MQQHYPLNKYQKDDVVEGLQKEEMQYFQGTVARERSSDEAISKSKSGETLWNIDQEELNKQLAAIEEAKLVKEMKIQ